MKIGIIGSGNIGGSLAPLWAQAGHDVILSSRHPDRLRKTAADIGPHACVGTALEAAQQGDVILLSIPLGEIPKLGSDVVQAMRGKIVMDTSNPYVDRDGEAAREVFREGKGTGCWTARHLQGIREVRAFNSVYFKTLQNEHHRQGDPIGVPIASDDLEALEVVSRLVRDAGFGPVAVRGLERAKEFDPDTPPYASDASQSQLEEMLGVHGSSRAKKTA